ncbi:MAG TPA: cytochrome c peroxidase, partial [Polyangia bacterium]
MSKLTTKDGTQIYYKDWGAGKPVVFSHGWPLGAESWWARMLPKTVLPVIAIAPCVLLLLAVSACGGSGSDAGVPLDRPASFTDKQWLGKQLFFDTNLSEPTGQACVACHASQVGWTGPDAVTNLGGAAYEGAVKGRFGNRKPPSSAYGGDSPILHLDATDGWTGGMTWDGHAPGLTLGDPLAEQALQPFVNPLEQNNASAGVVVDKVKQS